MEELRNKAEELRQAGDRAGYKKIMEQIKQEQYAAVQERHKQNLATVVSKYPVGMYIPEIHATVTEITDGCGTERGWIAIKAGGKSYTPAELASKIATVQADQKNTAYFRGLKFPASGRLRLGQYDDILDMLVSYMSLDRVWGLEEWNENNIDSFSDSYSYAHKQAIEDGYTDAQAEEAGQKAEDDARDEGYRKYRGKLIEAVNYLLKFAELELEEGKRHFWYLVPLKDWHKAADKVAEIITGYGSFEYNSGEELKETIPARTYCQAVVDHLHWIKHAPEVYGGRSYDYMMR